MSIFINLKKVYSSIFLIICFTSVSFFATAQESEEDVQTISIKSRGLQRVGNTFESIWLIDNQTVQVPMKRTFEFDIHHRFGTINNGYKDFIGIYAPSNIRIGFGYTPINNLMVGFGFSKERLIWDFFGKYALLKEKKGSPVSVSLLTSFAVDTRSKENFANTTDRLSYFHQLLLAKKLTRDFSVQASISLSHFNMVDAYINEEGTQEGILKNDHLAFSLLGRYKISDAFAFIANYDQPITKHLGNNPNPNLSFGVELATPLHAFQVFIGNYKWIVPQYNNVYNHNNYADKQFLIGFNITRLLDAQEEDLGDMMFKRKHKEH